MLILRRGDTIKLYLSAEDTRLWAGQGWPCSTLSGKTLFAEFVDGDLVDYAIDGKTNDDINMDVNEFNAITSDFMEAT